MRKISVLIILFLACILVNVPGAQANGFSLNAETAVLSTCATDTALYVIPITNTGGSFDSYTVSVSGSAAKWAVAAPSGFKLAPSETEYLYVYATPAMDALAGIYSLDVQV
ncbi:unnamed protein product, partial [marine sediment metagenome]